VSGQSLPTLFIYGGDGNLVKKIKPDNRKTLYVGGIYEVDKNSGDSVTGTKTYYPAAGAMRVNTTLYYVLKDHLGSASVMTSSIGAVVGEDRFCEAPPKHSGAGYSPKLGRFLSADTIVPGYANPQNLNRFSYVTNNPLRYIDPTGHLPIDGPCGYQGQDCGDTTSNSSGSGDSGNNDDEEEEDGQGTTQEQDPIDCNIQACIGVPDFWGLNPLHPDYYTLALSYSFVTVTLTVDRYGHVYWALGGSVNTSIIGGPPGISLMAGKIGQSLLDTSYPIPDVTSIPSFFPGFSGSIDVGLGPAGGLTFSPGSEVPNNIGTVSTTAFEGGLSTPFAGGSVTYGSQIKNATVNRAGVWLIQNVIMRLLP
jgi:hypothetical protein